MAVNAKLKFLTSPQLGVFVKLASKKNQQHAVLFLRAILCSKLINVEYKRSIIHH